MSEDNPTLEHYTIHLQGEEMDLERLDRMTRQLRGELLDLDAEAVDFVQEEEMPERTKAADAMTLGALAVTVLPNFLPRVVEYLQAWTLRGEGPNLKVKSQVGDRSIELEAALKFPLPVFGLLALLGFVLLSFHIRMYFDFLNP
jgi:hypothetical protein